MQLKKYLAPALALAACFFSGPAEAAPPSPDAQIDTFLDLPLTANDPLTAILRDHGYFTVTDLDGNGRLEFFFLRPVTGDLPEAVESASENEKAAWRAIGSIPVKRRLDGFEISAYGKTLDPIAISYTDEEINPDLFLARTACRAPGEDNPIYYDTRTLLRNGTDGFRLAAQIVSLKNGVLNVQTIGSEFGNYAFYREQRTPEAIPEYITDRYGATVPKGSLSDMTADYAAGCDERFRVSLRWHSLQDLREAKLQPDGMDDLLTETWNGFGLEPIK